MFASRYTATRVAARIGQALAIVFALVGLFSGNVILALIGGFIFFAASQEARVAKVRHAIGGTVIGTVMANDHPRFDQFDRIATVAGILAHTDST